MNYKVLVNAIVAFCMLTGLALMAYVEVKKSDLEKVEQIEVQHDLPQRKVGSCNKSK